MFGKYGTMMLKALLPRPDFWQWRVVSESRGDTEP